MKMPLEDAVNEGTFFGTFYLVWINDKVTSFNVTYELL